MARESIAMSREEVAALLADVGWVVVTTLDTEGFTVGDVAPCAAEDETLYFALPADGEAAGRIGTDSRVCCAADAYPTYYEIRGASVHGEARATDRHPGLGGDGAQTYALDLEDVMSFDFSKIQNKF